MDCRGQPAGRMRQGGRRLPQLLLAALAPVVIALAVAAAPAAPEGGQPPPDAAWHPPAAYAQQATPPKAANVTSDAQSRVYHLGEIIEIDVGFDKEVVIDPAAPPSLAVGLDGGVNRTAVYASGNNTAELTFAYTVQYGDVSSDLDYSWTDSLRGSLAGAGAGGGAANTTLPRPGGPDSLAGSGDILVDYAAPRLIAADTVNPGHRGFGVGNLYDVDVLRVENRTYAAAASNSNGLYLIRVHEGGYLSLAGAAPHLAGSSGTPSASRGVDAFTVDGSAYAIATSRSEHAVQLFRVHGNGTLEALGSIVDDDDLKLGEAAGVAAFDLEGTMHALVASWSEDAVQLVRVHGDGTLEARASWSLVDNATLALDAAHGVAAFDLNGTVHALVTGYSDNAVQLIRVHGNGTLEPRDSLNMSSGLPLTFPYRVTAFDLNGSTHALVASLGGSGVQLIRVHDNSSLEAVGSARDGDEAFEELAGSANVDVFGGASGGVYAMVSARGDHGVQLVRVREDGGMFAAGSADYTATGFSGLRSSSDVGVFALGGGAYALSVSWSSNAAALQLMRLSPAYPVHVTSTHADAAYGTGSEIVIDVRFAGPVRVEGAPPELRLGSGGTAPFLSGNNSNTLKFNYTVQEGEHAADLEQAGVAALSGAGAITDLATGLPANRTLPPPGSGRSLGDLKDIIVDGRVPPIASINSTAANGLYNTPGDEIDITVAYESTVRAAGPLHLRLNSGGTAHYISGDNSAELVFRYTVGPDESAADLDYAGLNTILGSGTIDNAATGDPAGRALPAPGGGSTLGDLKDIEVDTRAPSVASAAAPEDGVYGAGREINVTVGFDEPVRYSGDPPSLALGVGGEARAAAYASGNGTSELVFSYTVRAGDYEDDLDYRGTGALSGRIADLAANPANLTLPTSASLRASHDVLIDHAAPRLIAAAWASDGAGGANATGTFEALGTAADVDTIAANGSTYAVVASAEGGAPEGAVQLIRVHGNGTMEMEHEARSSELAYAYGVDAFYLGGAAHAIAAAHGANAVQLLRIHDNNDTLSPVHTLGDTDGNADTGLELGGATRARVFEMNDTLHALAAGFSDDGIQLVRVHGNGTLEARESWSLGKDEGDLELEEAFDAAVFDLGEGEKHALVTGKLDNGIQLVRIHVNGTLEPADSMDDSEGDLELGGARGVAVFDLDGGEKHALVSAESDNGIQLVRIRGDGTLHPAGSASDGDPGFDRLGDAFGISMLGGGSPGGVYAAVTSRANPGGVQLVHVRGEDGALLPAGSVADDAGGFAELRGAHGIAAFGEGGRSYALVAAIDDNGVQLIRTSTASVANVTTNAAGGPHGPGSAIDIGVAFDAPVLAEGPLELRLNTGGAARYVSGSGGSTLLFRYEVAAGDRDAAVLGYDGVHALRAGPGGSIAENATGLHANALLPPPGSPGSLGGSARVAVDTPPAVASVSSPDLPGTYGIGETIRIRMHFDEAVTVTGRPLLGLDTGGTDRDAGYASGSGGRTLLFTYTVGEGDESPTGLDYANASALSLGPGGAIVDATGNRANLTLPAPGSDGSLAGMPGLVVDGVRPVPASVSSPNATGPHGRGDTIHIVVNFSEPVTVRGMPLLALDTGQPGRSAEYSSGSGTAALLFLYTVAAGDVSTDLDYAGASALSLGPGGAIIDGAGNDARLALPAPGSGGSLGDTSDVSVRDASAGATAATARAAFTAPNTVRIEYSAPLGAPASHSGPVYGAVSIRGGASADTLGASGLGTEVHTVGFGGGGVEADQDGSIALNTRLEGAAAPGSPYEFAAGSIPVAAGQTVHTLTPAVLAPVVPIEPDGFVRVVNVVDGGDPARPSINVSALVPAAAGGAGQAIFPDSAGGVGVVTSFAEVWFPPGVRASNIPADGLIGLRVWGDAPGRESLAGRVAAALGSGATGDLVLQRVVAAGGGGAGGERIEFDMPVRVLLDGQAGGAAFYADGADGAIVPIRTECAADNTTAVHAQLGGSGECQVDSGGDKAVHTYHLTLFGTARGLTDLERAVALAPPGGTVLVPPGTYAGDVLTVDRPMSIRPADPADPPVFTGYSHIVVRPSADGPVAVSGLRFEDTTHTSGGEGLASIVVESLAGSEPGMPVSVRNNTFSNTCDGGVRAAADAGAPPIAGLDISGNRFYGVGANAAACASSPSAPDRADAIVLGRHGAFTAGSGTPQLAGLIVRDNYIFGTTYTGIRVAGAAGALIEGNHIESVPDDGIRVLPSSNVTVRGNTIVDANHGPHMPNLHDGADGAAIEVWAGSDDIAVTLNRISASAGALAVCAGTCDPGADAADGTGGDPVPVARAELGSADGANDVRFNHNALAASNAAPLVDNKAGGVLDARANYYPGRAESVAGGAGIAAAPGARVEYLPALDGGPVRIGAVFADGAGSSVRSIDAAAAAGFAAGADAFNAGQAAAGGTVGIEPVAHRVGSPDAADSKEHGAALAALLAGAGGDGRMRPVLENSIAKAMALYDGDAAAGLAAITAMEAEYGHYPFATARNGTVVAHGADPSLVGRADVVPRLAGGTDGLRALYDYADGTATVGMQGYPNASWKWWAYEFADPSAGNGSAPQQKRSMIALHAGPDEAAGTADDLVFGAGYYPPGAPQHLLVAAGDAAAAAAGRTGASGIVVSPTSTASALTAAGDALFRLVPPAPTAAGVAANLIAGDGAARAIVTSDNASLESRSMAAALASASSGLPSAGVRAHIVAFNSSEDGWAGPAMERIGAAVAGGGSGDTAAAAVVYTGRAAALAELAALPGAADAPAVSVRWYAAAGGLDRAALGEPAPALARTAGLAAVSQYAAPSAPIDAALGAAGIELDDSTRGPAYAAYDAAFLLGASISAAGPDAPASAAAGHMAGAALNRTDSALGGRLALDVNGDLALPDRYAVSRVGADGSWAAAAGGPLYGTGKCSVALASGDVDVGPVGPGRRSQAGAETVVNTGTRQFVVDGVSVSAGPWKYDNGGAGGQAADLDAALTMYRVQPGADYASVGAAGAALPGSDLWPSERLEVQYVLDLTSMPALAAGTVSQEITYSVECR